MIVFLIPEKIFLKLENLMCALRAHINRTLVLFVEVYKCLTDTGHRINLSIYFYFLTLKLFFKPNPSRRQTL